MSITDWPVEERPREMRDYVRLRLLGYAYEVFACLFLDNRHRVISFEELFSGTIDGTNVHPREVVRRALFHNAAAVILAHSHASKVADAEPRRETTRP
jgi:DNA repair protein RadC